MKKDITLRLTQKMLADEQANINKSLIGHTGTHFDVMDKEFPLSYACLRGVVFDVSAVNGRDIEPSDIDIERVREGMFVAFCTGFIEREQYGTKTYFKEHPQLSKALISLLLDKKIAIIGIDSAGIRRGSEHVEADSRCADRNVFVIENLCNLRELASYDGELTVHAYPLNVEGITGLPCRVIAELD